MTAPDCGRTPPLAELLEYLLGELPEQREDAFERHFFECEHCVRRLEAVERLAAAVADLVRAGRLSASVTREVVERAVGDGLKLREYALRPGTSVDCTAGPEDDFVVVRLAGPFGDGSDVSLEVHTEDLRGGSSSAPRRMEVSVDRAADEIVLLFAGDVVRSYPRSRWTLNVDAGTPADPRRLGPYVMNHTPWGELH